jgi:hypothetical protein
MRRAPRKEPSFTDSHTTDSFATPSATVRRPNAFAAHGNPSALPFGGTSGRIPPARKRIAAAEIPDANGAKPQAGSGIRFGGKETDCRGEAGEFNPSLQADQIEASISALRPSLPYHRSGNLRVRGLVAGALSRPAARRGLWRNTSAGCPELASSRYFQRNEGIPTLGR